jgi:acetyl-CoA synthetase/medium-chain acyl-CoA synthetase
MGKAMPGYDVQIVDNHGNILPPGEEGNIGVRCKPHRPVGLFVEYWKNPEETADRFVGDFYLTGDTARRDTEGYFWFTGRSDDIINSSSYRIGPTEVEDSLLTHPSVLECAAIGVPDEMRGEIVKAFVVLRPGFKPSDALAREIQTHCKKVTAPYKYPRQIEFIDALPKTVSGKTRRVALRQLEHQRRLASLL